VAEVRLLPLWKRLIGLGFVARLVVSIALIAPFGLAMGMAMPLGLRRLAILYPDGIPYAFRVNGMVSGVAPVLTAAATITFGGRAASFCRHLLHAAAIESPARGWSLVAAAAAALVQADDLEAVLKSRKRRLQHRVVGATTAMQQRSVGLARILAPSGTSWAPSTSKKSPTSSTRTRMASYATGVAGGPRHVIQAPYL
jgi:hypothetical protein